MIALLSGIALTLATLLPWQEDWTRDEAQQIQDVQRALASGKYQEALTILAELKEERPDTGLLARLSGHALAGLGRTPEAREAFVRALGTGQFAPDVFAKLMELDQAADRRVSMLVETAMLALFVPDDPSWQRTLADLLAANELTDAALVTYAALFERPDASPDLAWRMGRIHARAGRADDALFYLETAWYAGVQDAELPRLMASLWQQEGDLERAALWSGRAPSKDGDVFRDHLRRAELLLASGDAAGAVEPARAALAATDPGVQARAAVLLGHAAHQAGDTEGAVQSFRRALELGEADAQIQVYVARSLLERGDAQAALPYLDALLARGIDDRPTLEAAIRALLPSGDADKLRALLTRYLELYGPDERADRWIAALAKRLRA